MKKVLGIETSCDDTSVAIVSDNGQVLSVVSANQDLAHAPFGGVVPEIACRNHTMNLLPLVEEAFKKSNLQWTDIDGIAVTNRPGLIGSLIVGLVTAKTLAQAKNLPLIGINHLEGHIVAPLLRDEQYQPPADFQYPFIALAISGGHTTIYHVHNFGRYEILGATLDDAAGEAYDKFAKMLGLEFPGGVKVDHLAQKGDAQKYDFPRSMIKDPHFNMSFSGLKSAAHRLLQTMSADEIKTNLPDLCASFQEAVVDVLISKLDRAVKEKKLKRAIVTGGVSANSRLRQRAQEWAAANKVQLVIPPLRYCTDNAAMIAYAGLIRLRSGERDDLSLAPSPSPLATDFLDGVR
ncbi:MAG: tRNA N6-adenosine threonylcarbamoyltransferase [Oligoflexia bacterium]|nr:MAG: tRNA N6-adenosine threonylcarbamoyltransferase [Oligoflexia bacterium]